VESSPGKGFYLVNGTCNCQDAQERSEVHHGWCKDKLAVEIFKETPQEPEDKPRGRKSKAPAPTEGQGGYPNDDELEEMARRYGHHIPGDSSPVQDDRPLEEQLKDLFNRSHMWEREAMDRAGNILWPNVAD
jgi:hypothetical protein